MGGKTEESLKSKEEIKTEETKKDDAKMTYDKLFGNDSAT
jgi:hypothetical protein